MSIENELFNVLRYVENLYKDLSQVLRAVDAYLGESGYVSLWSPCYFNGSKAVYQPSAWAPKTFTRNYVREGERARFGLFLFFNVYLTPARADQAMSAWGWAMKKPEIDYWPSFNKYVLPATGPAFPIEDSAALRPLIPAASPQGTKVEAVRALSECFDSMEIAAAPLIHLNSEVNVQQTVIGPLLARVEIAAPVRDSGVPDISREEEVRRSV
jgi:hypothetical protein